MGYKTVIIETKVSIWRNGWIIFLDWLKLFNRIFAHFICTHTHSHKTHHDKKKLKAVILGWRRKKNMDSFYLVVRQTCIHSLACLQTKFTHIHTIHKYILTHSFTRTWAQSILRSSIALVNAVVAVILSLAAFAVAGVANLLYLVAFILHRDGTV